MKISGFTIARNCIKFNYPILESIQSILPICDEFIVNLGNSEDQTEHLIKSLKSPKIKLIYNDWDLSMGKEVLSHQTNIALRACTGDWAFYLQSDEVVHEDDLPRLKSLMQNNLHNKDVDAFRFLWLHFYGSYYRYRIDHGWYQKQDRIIRNNGQIESYEDAYGFRRKDGADLKRKMSWVLMYHYGWVQPTKVMAQRRNNAEEIGFVRLKDDERNNEFSYGDLKRFHPYFGSHPKVMDELIKNHALSQKDLESIGRDYWWHPGKWLNLRYKTGRRIKENIV